MLARNQLSTGAGRWHRSLPASYDQRVALYASVPTVAAELAARRTDVEVAVSLLEADGAALGRDVTTVPAELLVRGADVDIVAAPSEADVLSLDADLAWTGTVAAAEGDVALGAGVAWRGPAGLLAAPDGDVELLLLSLDFAASTASRVAAAQGDVVYLALPHGGGRGRGTAADGDGVVVVEAAATTAGWGSREAVFVAVPSAQDHGPGSGTVVAEEVGGTAARVAATAQLYVELVIVAVAAVAVAVKVALALLVQLGGRVAARHGAGGLWVRGGSARGGSVRGGGLGARCALR